MPVLAGRIHSIQISPGGAPKRPVPSATVGEFGLDGDGHDDTANHGGPERAVSLWSLEVIEALQREGHPVFPGAAGENVTIAGLRWAEVQPGDRIELGAEVVLEATRFTSPCKTIKAAFTDGRFGRISNDKHPGWSRMYARVVQGGAIRPGDRVLVLGRSA